MNSMNFIGALENSEKDGSIVNSLAKVLKPSQGLEITYE